jgi:predicted nuclease of predicted toxin-antitoxin system
MKIILDESVPLNLRWIIGAGHTVVTAWYQGWSGLKNGALLDAAEAAGDLFITADQEMSYQQNLTGRKMALLVLSTNNWSFIKAGVGEIMAAIDQRQPAAMLRWKSRFSNALPLSPPYIAKGSLASSQERLPIAC